MPSSKMATKSKSAAWSEIRTLNANFNLSVGRTGYDGYEYDSPPSFPLPLLRDQDLIRTKSNVEHAGIIRCASWSGRITLGVYYFLRYLGMEFTVKTGKLRTREIHAVRPTPLSLNVWLVLWQICNFANDEVFTALIHRIVLQKA